MTTTPDPNDRCGWLAVAVPRRPGSPREVTTMPAHSTTHVGEDRFGMELLSFGGELSVADYSEPLDTAGRRYGRWLCADTAYRRAQLAELRGACFDGAGSDPAGE